MYFNLTTGELDYESTLNDSDVYISEYDWSIYNEHLITDYIIYTGLSIHEDYNNFMVLNSNGMALFFTQSINRKYDGIHAVPYFVFNHDVLHIQKNSAVNIYAIKTYGLIGENGGKNGIKKYIVMDLEKHQVHTSNYIIFGKHTYVHEYIHQFCDLNDFVGYDSTIKVTQYLDSNWQYSMDTDCEDSDEEDNVISKFNQLRV